MVAEGAYVWGGKGMYEIHHTCVYTSVLCHDRPALRTDGLPPTKRKSEALHCKLRNACTVDWALLLASKHGIQIALT